MNPTDFVEHLGAAGARPSVTAPGTASSPAARAGRDAPGSCQPPALPAAAGVAPNRGPGFNPRDNGDARESDPRSRDDARRPSFDFPDECGAVEIDSRARRADCEGRDAVTIDRCHGSCGRVDALVLVGGRLLCGACASGSFTRPKERRSPGENEGSAPTWTTGTRTTGEPRTADRALARGALAALLGVLAVTSAPADATDAADGPSVVPVVDRSSARHVGAANKNFAPDVSRRAAGGSSLTPGDRPPPRISVPVAEGRAHSRRGGGAACVRS